MKDMIRASDITEALTTIKVLNDRVSELQRDLNDWKINFDIEIEPHQSPNGDNTFNIVITASKGNGKGRRTTISENDILYFTGDRKSLLNNIITSTLIDLLFDDVQSALLPQFNRAADNVLKIISKKQGKQ